ncbi:MAG: patatin-like phospholipase family protein [Acidobacteriota bacterium]|nr:patatin-like phospholipase family protein [Acidobacteriota bacterium]MDH3785947.1 patatin-like phospholipase family protein [Acidobacteriota bacterium]
MSQVKNELAFLLYGGGARAAYQAGYLRGLGRLLPDLRVDIIVGISAGAINAAGLASIPGNFRERTEELARLWSELTTSDVFDVRGYRLLRRSLHWILKLGGGGRFSDPRGLLDNSPLRALLSRVLPSEDGQLLGVTDKMDRGELHALAILASSYETGRSVSFVQGRELNGWQRPHRIGVSCEIGIRHVMASAALPFLFPAERVDGTWYGDGGMRLTTPLSPAIHLGADRILAISTRYDRSVEEAERPEIVGYPPPAQVAGVLLNSIFLDALDGDALRLERINSLLDGEQQKDLRPIDLRTTRPSVDLGILASAHEHDTPGALRFLARGTGTKETRSNDLLSLVLFEPSYLSEMIRVGEDDAAQNAEELVRFLAPTISR